MFFVVVAVFPQVLPDLKVSSLSSGQQIAAGVGNGLLVAGQNAVLARCTIHTVVTTAGNLFNRDKLFVTNHKTTNTLWAVCVGGGIYI